MSNKVTIDISGDERLLAILDAMPKLLLASGGPLDRAVSKAATVVTRRARQLAPDSRKTGTKEKQSKSAKAIWANHVRQTIQSKVIKYATSRRAIVGPRSPIGNAAHFMQEKPRRHVLWGKATRVQMYRITRDWIVQAYDETLTTQQDVMEQSLLADLDKVMGL